eukprot:TRINITY_DN11928_c0_g1_i1.p1 TRINITY_DN11928_c0_g1~~TRINITY_DN11928_c0_g1_i1.p1  ORF type:complete len:244 (+),score=5.70 TRINITY_DN11928_c0_g1_i1:60-734(+)
MPPPLEKQSPAGGGSGDVCIRITPATVIAGLQLNLSPHMPAVRWCDKCENVKPPMTHHCHICERCVLKMDHHCPWMHNCIGFRNYRFFFLFLVYLWGGCAYAVTVATLLIADKTKMAKPLPGVLFTFVVTLSVFIALSLLLGWHVYLVATAQTTIDFYDFLMRKREAKRAGRVWVNEFDMGVLQNFQNTFDVSGPFWFLLMFLPRASLPRGDGIHFPTIHDTRS